MFAVVRRATLLYPSGARDRGQNHLFIILNDPFGPADQVLIVPACSLPRGAFDQTCILRPGDHDFLKHDSYVAYAHCRIEPAQKLVNGVRTGQFSGKGLLQEEVFERVLAGLGCSKFAKPFAPAFLREIETAMRRK